MSKWVNPHSGTPSITIMTSQYCPLFIPDNRCSCLCYAIGIKTRDDLFRIPSQWNFQYTAVKFQPHCSGRKIGLKGPIFFVRKKIWFCPKEISFSSEGKFFFLRTKFLVCLNGTDRIFRDTSGDVPVRSSTVVGAQKGEIKPPQKIGNPLGRHEAISSINYLAGRMI